MVRDVYNLLFIFIYLLFLEVLPQLKQNKKERSPKNLCKQVTQSYVKIKTKAFSCSKTLSKSRGILFLGLLQNVCDFHKQFVWFSSFLYRSHVVFMCSIVGKHRNPLCRRLTFADCSQEPAKEAS